MARKKNNTCHQESHQSLSSLLIQKRVQCTSIKYEHCHFSFFLEGGKTFILAALSQFQEVALIPQAAGIETITNLEGICLGGKGLLGWKKIPLVLSELLVSLGWLLSLPGCWKRKWNFLHRWQKLLQSRVLYLHPLPMLKQVLMLFRRLLWSQDPLSCWPLGQNTLDTKISSYIASPGFRWQHKTSRVKNDSY